MSFDFFPIFHLLPQEPAAGRAAFSLDQVQPPAGGNEHGEEQTKAAAEGFSGGEWGRWSGGFTLLLAIKFGAF